MSPPGHPGGHLPLDPGEVPLLPGPDQPGLEELHQAQPQPQQVLHEGRRPEMNIKC